jgi:hypothetical protein
MATPERIWDRGEHDEEPFRLNLVGHETDEADSPEYDSDPWADLGIAVVIGGIVLSLVLPLS